MTARADRTTETIKAAQKYPESRRPGRIVKLNINQATIGNSVTEGINHILVANIDFLRR